MGMWLIGDEYVYELGLLGCGALFLLLSAPVLMFIGYYLTKALLRRPDDEKGAGSGGAIRAIDAYIMPPDLNWQPFTTDSELRREIVEAVLRCQHEQKVKTTEFRYDDYARYLQTEAAHAVARSIPLLGAYSVSSVHRALGIPD